jgi:FtsH-binding integral membrane protein
VSPSAQPTADPRVKQARARVLMSVVWLAGAAAVAALLIAGHDSTPSGSAMAALGGGFVIGVVIAFALIAVNASLARTPDRVDARGAADLLCFATVLVGVATVVGVLAFGADAGAGVVGALVIFAFVMFGALLVTGLWTRASAQRRPGVPQP